MEAILKGETHLSRRDKRALMEMDLSEFDAVFREGYDKDHVKRDMSLLYALFAIGHLVYGATFGRLYFSTDKFKERVENHDLVYYNQIDTTVYETYELTSLRNRLLLVFLSPVLAAIILGIVVTPVHWALVRIAPSLLPIFSIGAGIAVIFVSGFVWAFSFFTLIMGEVKRDRDEIMAENIIELAEKAGHQKVLVSCGGAHCSGISSVLEENGWETEIRTTESPVGKMLLWKDCVVEALVHPRTSLRAVYSRLRSGD